MWQFKTNMKKYYGCDEYYSNHWSSKVILHNILHAMHIGVSITEYSVFAEYYSNH